MPVRLLTASTHSWGRILAAAGAVPLSVPLDPTRVNVSFIPTDGSPALPLLVNGEPEKVDEVRAKQILTVEDLAIRVELGLGTESAKYWTCDFSYVSVIAHSSICCALTRHDRRSTSGLMVTIEAR